MEGLRVVLPGKFQHFLAGHFVGAEVGPGPDLQVFVYDKEPGRGTREVLDKFVYGKEEPPAPPKSANYAVVGGNLETRNKLKSTRGSIAPLSTGFIDGHPDLVAVSASGGGLTAGIALAVKARVPQARLLTAEPEGFDDHARSFRSGRRERNAALSGTICDALMAQTPGELTFEINRALVGAGAAAATGRSPPRSRSPSAS